MLDGIIFRRTHFAQKYLKYQHISSSYSTINCSSTQQRFMKKAEERYALDSFVFLSQRARDGCWHHILIAYTTYTSAYIRICVIILSDETTSTSSRLHALYYDYYDYHRVCVACNKRNITSTSKSDLSLIQIAFCPEWMNDNDNDNNSMPFPLLSILFYSSSSFSSNQFSSFFLLYRFSFLFFLLFARCVFHLNLLLCRWRRWHVREFYASNDMYIYMIFFPFIYCHHDVFECRIIRCYAEWEWREREKEKKSS